MTRAEREQVVDWFAERMKDKLREPRNEAKPSWRTLSPGTLLGLLRCELAELKQAIRTGESDDRIIGECVDVAAFALMIADVCNLRMSRPADKGALKECCTCHQELPLERFSRNAAMKDGLNKQCKPCANTSSTRIRLADRLEALRRYSGGEPRCACCGETYWEFLAIDHISGGGRHHAKMVNGNLVRWLKRNAWPDGFRVLCHNCNMAYGFYGMCPHQSGSTRKDEAAAHSRRRGGDRRSEKFSSGS